MSKWRVGTHFFSTSATCDYRTRLIPVCLYCYFEVGGGGGECLKWREISPECCKHSSSFVGYSHNIKLEPPDPKKKKNEVTKQERQKAQEERTFPFNPRLIKRVRRADRNYTYTGLSAMLNPLKCAVIPLSSDSEDEAEDKELKKQRALRTTSAQLNSSTATLALQNHQFSSGSTRQVNAPVEPMEGHSSLASYSHHHQQIQQDFQNAPNGNHPYFQQHHFGPGSNNGQQQQMMYGNEYDQHNQASTSSGPPPHMHQQYHQQNQQGNQYDQQHTVRYEPLPHQPHSAPPQQRNFVPQYPVKVVDANNYGQINRTVNAPPPIVTKPLPPPAPPPSAPPTMGTPRKTPPSFLKRQPDAQEQQRLDYEVAKNVSQIMSKNGMKVTQEPILPSPKPLPPLAPVSGKPTYQCPSCNRNLANARNLQRHRLTCGNTMISSSPLPNHTPHQINQHNAPQLAAMLQRSPPAPSVSAPPPQHTPQSAPSTSSFQHHNSTGNLGMGLAQQQQNALYSPQEMMNDPNAFFGVGFELKDDPMMFQGPSTSTLWPRDDSFHSEPNSAPHDQLDLSDPLGFNEPLHHIDGLESDNQKETPRDFQEPEELSTLDPNPQCHNQFFGISLDPELEMPLSLDVDEPLTRSDTPNSQDRETPLYQCEACKKTVQSDRSLRRHYTTCKAFQADLVAVGEERPPVVKKRRVGTGVKRTKKIKLDGQDGVAPTVDFPEKNSAILAALRGDPPQNTMHLQHKNAHYIRMMRENNQAGETNMSYHHPNHDFPNGPQSSIPPNVPQQQQYQPSYGAPLPGGALPSISASWLSNSSSSQSASRDNSRSSSAMFTPPMASSTPIPFHKSSPLEDLLNEDEPTAEEDGDSRSSNGAAASARQSGSQYFSCEFCAKQLCSASNLKRHRATCKAAGLSLSTSNPSSQPATPAPEPAAPLPVIASQPSLETTAVVTYTKSIPMVSPKLKMQPTAGSQSDTQPSSGSGTPIKSAMTVGEALRAQHQQHNIQKQRFSNIDQHQQPPPPMQSPMQGPMQGQMQGQMHQHPRFQQQMNQSSAVTMPPARIPPRPPNPILNVQQNPPQQQVHQQQIQQMASSRQGPPSQHQITVQQMPQLPNAVLHTQLQLQSPPKKGIIELRHTDLVHITSEPLPTPQEKRANYQGPPHVVQMQQQQVHQNGQQGPPQNQQDQMDQKRRSSEGQVNQSQPLPSIQLPQRQPQQQQQTQVSAYQVQFNGRPLPPMQLPPKQNVQNAPNNQYQMNQQPQQQQNHPMNQMHQQQQQHSQMHQNQSMKQQQQFPMQMNSQQQHQQMTPLPMQSPRIQPQQNFGQSMNQMNQQLPPMQSPRIHQNQQMNQQMLQQQQVPQMAQRPKQEDLVQPQQQPTQSSQPQSMPRKNSLPMDVQPPPAKRGRSQSTAVQMMNTPSFPETFDSVKEEFPNPLDSPMDSIITSMPLHVEVSNHLPPPGIAPEQGQSSADSTSMEPSPRVGNANSKAHQQAYICPECDKVYSCRKNVKRHRQAVHKMTLEQVLAKPEQPASDEQAAAAALSMQRRHTITGTELEKITSAVSKNAGAKRKASTAAMVAKKGKEAVFEKPTILEEAMESDSVASENSNGPLPSAQTLITLTNMESCSPQNPIAKVTDAARSMAPQRTPTPVIASNQSPARSTSTPQADQGLGFRSQQSMPNSQDSQQVMSQVPVNQQSAAPTVLPPMSFQLPPLQLPPLQEAAAPNKSPSWNSVSMPNSAPPTAVSTARNTRSTEVSEEDDAKAMAEIAAALKQSAETAAKQMTEEERAMTEDEMLFRRIRNGGVLEDVGDVSEFLSTGQETDSTSSSEVDRTFGQLPPLSTSSSVGLPSLSSPGDQYLQQQQQQQQQQYQYHQQPPQQQQQQMQMWNNGYQPQNQQFVPQENGFVPEQNIMQYNQTPIHYDAPQNQMMPMNMMPESQEQHFQQQQPMQFQQQQVAEQEPQQFQEPQRPASQPPPVRGGRRNPKAPQDLRCHDCNKTLGSDYSLRRHRVKCIESQQQRNPDYIRPTQRRVSRNVSKIIETKFLGEKEKVLADQIAAAAERHIEELEALPPPSVVHDLVDEFQKDLDDGKKQEQTTSPLPTDEASVTPLSSSSPSSSSSSSTVFNANGVMQQVLLQRVESR